MSALAESCPCPPEAAKLREMATEEGYKAQVGGDTPTGRKRALGISVREPPVLHCSLCLIEELLDLLQTNKDSLSAVHHSTGTLIG